MISSQKKKESCNALRRIGNQHVTLSNRSYHAVRTEVIQTFWDSECRMNRDCIRDLQSIFAVDGPEEIGIKTEAFGGKMKLDIMQLADNVHEVFVQHPRLRESISANERFETIEREVVPCMALSQFVYNNSLHP